MLMDDFEVLDSADTPIGLLYLNRRKLLDGSETVVTEVMLDGALLMSSENTVSEHALATSALALHAGGDELRVLVGGLGLGYTAHAALESGRVAALGVVDRLPKVGEWLHDGYLPLSATLAVDERFTLIEADVYRSLLGPAPEHPWDLLLIDVDHSPRNRLDEASEPFYTVEGQRRVAQHLAPGGVLAVWSAKDDDAFAGVLEEVYAHAEREQVRWTCENLGGPMEHVLFLARRD